MKVIIKFFLFLLLLTGVVYFSYENSASLYRFYTGYYYKIRYTEKELLKNLESLYKEKKYEKIIEIQESTENHYPLNAKFKLIASASYLKLKNELDGAVLFMSAVNGEAGDYFLKENEKIPEILYVNKSFGDLVSMYDNGIARTNVNFSFYYSVALYHRKRLDEAYSMIKYSFDNGYIGADINKYMGMILEDKKEFKRSLFYYKRAYSYNKNDKSIGASLVRVYRKLGMYSESEKILRNMK